MSPDVLAWTVDQLLAACAPPAPMLRLGDTTAGRIVAELRARESASALALVARLGCSKRTVYHNLQLLMLAGQVCAKAPRRGGAALGAARPNDLTEYRLA